MAGGGAVNGPLCPGCRPSILFRGILLIKTFRMNVLNRNFRFKIKLSGASSHSTCPLSISTFRQGFTLDPHPRRRSPHSTPRIRRRAIWLEVRFAFTLDALTKAPTTDGLPGSRSHLTVPIQILFRSHGSQKKLGTVSSRKKGSCPQTDCSVKWLDALQLTAFTTYGHHEACSETLTGIANQLTSKRTCYP